jgi:crotonobetainyl-CoA:carnitine CoA-transferase CaiB-like acyl-CoA transferase
MRGPFCSYQLSLLGAEVVKVERPKFGDDFRARGGPGGMGPSFVPINAGKRSITLDLKNPKGRDVVIKMIEQGDVLIENFRPGVLKSMGLDYESARKINPKIIYCAISGFGQTGPMKDWSAFEGTIEALSGMQLAGFKGIDTYTGYVSYAAILAALFQRERTGEGQFIDVAMLDSAMLLMSVAVGGHLLTQAQGAGQPSIPARASERPARAAVGPHKAQDREVFLGALHDHWFHTFANVLELDDVANDERYKTFPGRQKNYDELTARLTERLAQKPAAEWERLLIDAGIPTGVIRPLTETVEMEHVTERDPFVRVGVPGMDQKVKLVGSAYRYAHDGPAKEVRSVPTLGEHTDEVLAELGYGASAIAELRDSGAL